MKIILISIDGLGVGKMPDTEVKANTWETLIKNSNWFDFKFLKKISKKWNQLALDYKGADSYLGHLTMSGIKTYKVNLMPLSFYFKKITKLLKKHHYQYEIFNGIIKVENKFLIYDNFEAEHGLAINIAGVEDKFSFDKQIIISKKIRKIIKNPRLISFTAKKIKMRNYLSNLISNHPFYGIITPKTGVYNNTYKVMHLPFINKFKKTVQYQFAKKGWKVYLYGKFANIIKIENHKNVVINEEINFTKILTNLKSHLKEKTFYCINIQQTDLAGHDGDIKKYIKILNQIDPELEKLSQQKNLILIITSDHGNDPFLKNGKHTREYVPFWANQVGIKISLLSQVAEYIKKLI